MSNASPRDALAGGGKRNDNIAGRPRAARAAHADHAHRFRRRGRRAPGAPPGPGAGCATETLEQRLVFSAAVLNALSSFASPPTGYDPRSTLVQDASGNLFGTTVSGGAQNVGTVFEVAAGSNSLTALASFNGANGANPAAGVTLDASGNLFGTTFAGGAGGVGTVFEVAKGSNAITALASFNTTNGANPLGGVAIDSAGNLFGTASAGGDNAIGTAYEVAKGSGAITALASFAPETGVNPQGAVALDPAGNLFGVAQGGGDANSDGTVFEVAHGTNTITPVALFDVVHGADPRGGITLDASGNLFGTTHGGGTHAQGTVFEVAKGTGTITTLASFVGANGSAPTGAVALDSSGNIFGTTPTGGTTLQGTVFEVSKGAGSAVALVSFNGANGAGPSAGVVLAPSGVIYGTTEAGGASTGDAGTVFQFNPAGAGAAAVVTVATFHGPDAGAPQTGVALDPSGNLFGTLESGGAAGQGAVYKIPAGSNAITLLASFTGANGSRPQGGVTADSAGNVFGTTAFGGATNDGVVYEIASGSNVITALASFTGLAGEGAACQLALDSAGNLYGTTTAGGGGDGLVFELAKGSHSVTPLAYFNGANGSSPTGAVAVDSAGNVYGTTQYGGDDNGDGVVFEVAKGTGAVTDLAQFSGDNGSNPVGGVTLDASGNLFGAASAGGAGGIGTVFEVAKGTNTLTALGSFGGASGANPLGAVTLDASGNLFGAASAGGASGNGTVFEVVKGSNTITPLASFNGANGTSPQGPIVRNAAGSLFGTTAAGGTANNGAIFDLYQPVKLAFLQPPANGTAGTALSPAVTVGIEDSAGALTGDTTTVTLTLTGGTFAGGATTATATAVGGIATFPNLVINNPGTYTLTASDGALPTAKASFTLVTPGTAAPEVAGVSVGSSKWSSGFPYGTSGYAIPTGAGQLVDLPWINLDRVSITFNGAVNVAQGSLIVTGVNKASYATSGFSYDPSTFTATWTFAAPLGADKLKLDLASTGPNAVTGASGATAGVALDGTWTNGSSAFPSGGGSAGTDFLYNLNVLPGDVTRNGSENILDVIQVRNAQFTSPGNPSYSPFLDVDGNGTINILDVIAVRNRQFTALPAGTP